MKKLFFISFFVFFAGILSFAQGVISGKVTDNASGETIPGVKVFVEGQQGGAISDLDGNYVLKNLKAGNHTIHFKYSGYNTVTVTDINVTHNEVTTIDAKMEIYIKDVGTVTVTAKVNKESSSNLLTLQKNSISVVDGVSQEALRKTPDKSVGDALKRISGATIQDNKFAIIRGLNDRYNAAFLNGSILPSSESDRKAFSFDIFPVNMLDNLTILKTASPDLPAEFAGGIIQIKTKDIPDKNFHSFSFGGAYNTITTFKNRTSYNGGKLDWLGLDDGSRKMPSVIPSQADFPTLMSEQATLAQQFTSDWALKNKLFMPNFNMQYAMGLNDTLFGKEFGLVGSLSYNRSFNYNQTIRRAYTDNAGGGDGASQIEYDLLDKVYSTQLLAGAMLNFSMKLNKNNIIGFKNLYSINSDDRVIARTGELNPLDVNPSLLRSNARWFTSNNIYSGQLTGEHANENGKIRFDWVGGYSNIVRTIPNLRRTVYTRFKDFNDPSDPNPYDTMYVANISQTNVGSDYGGGMFFSTNKESIASFKANLTFKLDTIIPVKTEIKIGGLIQHRSRDFEARQLGYTKYGASGGNVSFDNSLLYQGEDSIFRTENMGLIRPGVGGFKLTDGTKPTDAYQASSNIQAGYIAIDNKFSKKFRLNWGARAEYFTQQLTAIKSDYSELNIQSKKLDILPSFNFIYSKSKKENIRLSGSQTLNRPEYRELAPFAFYDFNTQFVISGNDSLQRAKITNLDLRYEWFPGKNQILSGTLFYKHFENPIEQIARPDVMNEISYKNVPTAQNYGIELEFRSLLGSTFHADSTSFLNNLTLFSSVAIIRSVVDVSKNVGTPYQTRPLQGQSPYVFNGGLSYTSTKTKMSYSLNINRVGPRISILGSVLQPDIWEKSRTFLDFQVSKMCLKDKMEVKFNFQNILAQKQIFYQNNYNTTQEVSAVRGAMNSLFLGDKKNVNGYNSKTDDLVWSTNFGPIISFVVTYKL